MVLIQGYSFQILSVSSPCLPPNTGYPSADANWRHFPQMYHLNFGRTWWPLEDLLRVQLEKVVSSVLLKGLTLDLQPMNTTLGGSDQLSAHCSSCNPHWQITSCLCRPEACWVAQPYHWSLLCPSLHNSPRKATPYMAGEILGTQGCCNHEWYMKCTLKSAVLSARHSLPIHLPSRRVNSWWKMPHFANRPLY